MKIDIRPNQTILDLKKQFHGYFPYLKIEFFSKPHDVSGASSKASIISNETSISELVGSDLEGSVEMTALTTVRALEQQFSEQFGLHMQVFRRSGKVFLETTTTDDWSLAQQNAEGKASTIASGESSSIDFTDRDQWE